MKPQQGERRKLSDHGSKMLTIEDKQNGSEFKVSIRSEEEEKLLTEILTKEISIKLNLSYGGNSSAKKKGKSNFQISQKRLRQMTNNNSAKEVQYQIEKISELNNSMEEIPAKKAKSSITNHRVFWCTKCNKKFTQISLLHHHLTVVHRFIPELESAAEKQETGTNKPEAKSGSYRRRRGLRSSVCL